MNYLFLIPVLIRTLPEWSNHVPTHIDGIINSYCSVPVIDSTTTKFAFMEFGENHRKFAIAADILTFPLDIFVMTNAEDMFKRFYANPTSNIFLNGRKIIYCMNPCKSAVPNLFKRFTRFHCKENLTGNKDDCFLNHLGAKKSSCPFIEKVRANTDHSNLTRTYFGNRKYHLKNIYVWKTKKLSKRESFFLSINILQIKEVYIIMIVFLHIFNIINIF